MELRESDGCGWACHSHQLLDHKPTDGSSPQDSKAYRRNFQQTYHIDQAGTCSAKGKKYMGK